MKKKFLISSRLRSILSAEMATVASGVYVANYYAVSLMSRLKTQTIISMKRKNVMLHLRNVGRIGRRVFTHYSNVVSLTLSPDE